MHAAEAFCFSGSVVCPCDSFWNVFALLSFRPVEKAGQNNNISLPYLFYSERDFAFGLLVMVLDDLTRLILRNCDCRYVAKLSLAWV